MKHKYLLSFLLVTGVMFPQLDEDNFLNVLADSVKKATGEATRMQQQLDKDLREATYQLAQEGKAHFLIPSPSKGWGSLIRACGVLGFKVATLKIAENPELIPSVPVSTQETLLQLSQVVEKFKTPVLSEFDTTKLI